MYYSATLNGFIPDGWKDDGTYSVKDWPADAVLLDEDEAETYQGKNPPQGKALGAVNGRPAWVDLPPPEPLTAEELTLAAGVKRDELLRLAAIRIAPLQDAVDLDDATEEESALLKDWKRYRVALNRIQDQQGYPEDISWPEQLA